MTERPRTLGGEQLPRGIIREATVDEISMAELIAALCVMPYENDEQVDIAEEDRGFIRGAFTLASKILYPDLSLHGGISNLLNHIRFVLDDEGKYCLPTPQRDDNGLLRWPE